MNCWLRVTGDRISTSDRATPASRTCFRVPTSLRDTNSPVVAKAPGTRMTRSPSGTPQPTSPPCLNRMMLTAMTCPQNESTMRLRSGDEFEQRDDLPDRQIVVTPHVAHNGDELRQPEAGGMAVRRRRPPLRPAS